MENTLENTDLEKYRTLENTENAEKCRKNTEIQKKYRALENTDGGQKKKKLEETLENT